VNDRNGTQDLVDAMRFSSEDFELVIKAQTGTVNNTYGDPRITIDFTEASDEAELYRDFDAMILPRRYGGQCLPMTEALCSGLPVIMTDVEPNNLVLPPHWLVQSSNVGQFLARTAIDLYTVNHYLLGERLDFLARADLVSDKKLAYNIGYREFSNYELETKWDDLIKKVAM
jgi:glycosyltransferase involved in cell wall biosynthesis